MPVVIFFTELMTCKYNICIFILPLNNFSVIAIMPIKQIDHGTKEYKQMVDLRYEILRKPLHLSFENNELTGKKTIFLSALLKKKKCWDAACLQDWIKIV